MRILPASNNGTNGVPRASDIQAGMPPNVQLRVEVPRGGS
jgi:hypothetical protein